MDQKRIRDLFALLPPGAAYPPSPRRSPFRPAQADPVEHFAFALHDPAFGSNFVEAHLKQRRWLPDTISEWSLLQFHAARWLGVSEPLMTEVESFRTETRRQERNLLDALLLAEDATLAGIADTLHASEETIEAYEVLFWNVRDRRDEKLFINALLYPAGMAGGHARHQAQRRGGPPAPAAAAKAGQDEVLVLAGWSSGKPAGIESDAASRFDLALQTDADRRWSAGARLEDPVIKAMHQGSLRRQEKATDDDPLTLHHINAAPPPWRRFESITASTHHLGHNINLRKSGPRSWPCSGVNAG